MIGCHGVIITGCQPWGCTFYIPDFPNARSRLYPTLNGSERSCHGDFVSIALGRTFSLVMSLMALQREYTHVGLGFPCPLLEVGLSLDKSTTSCMALLETCPRAGVDGIAQGGESTGASCFNAGRRARSGCMAGLRLRLCVPSTAAPLAGERALGFLSRLLRRMLSAAAACKSELPAPPSIQIL